MFVWAKATDKEQVIALTMRILGAWALDIVNYCLNTATVNLEGTVITYGAGWSKL